jgi:hypothetical protein
MTFEQQMDRFFQGYGPKIRERVENDTDYREAVESQNVVAAQEVAQRLIHGEAKNMRQTRKLRSYY